MNTAKILKLTKSSKSLLKGEKLAQVVMSQEVEQEAKPPAMSNEQLEDYLQAFLRRYESYRLRPYEISAQGGYRRPAVNLDEIAQECYDSVILRQDGEDIRSKIIAKALKVVKNFSTAYVKTVLKRYQDKMTPIK